MLKRILSYGAVAGLIVGVPLLALGLTMKAEPSVLGMVIGFGTMLIALTVVFVAVKRWRDEDLGGVVRFWPALGMALAISAVAGLGWVIAWEIVLMIRDDNFIQEYVQLAIEQKRASGASPAEMAVFVEEQRKLIADYANPIYRMAITFCEMLPVSVPMSLLAAALLRNPRFLPARATAPAPAP